MPNTGRPFHSKGLNLRCDPPEKINDTSPFQIGLKKKKKTFFLEKRYFGLNGKASDNLLKLMEKSLDQ